MAPCVLSHFDDHSLLLKGGTSLRKCRLGMRGRFSTGLDFVAPGDDTVLDVCAAIYGATVAGFSSDSNLPQTTGVLTHVRRHRLAPGGHRGCLDAAPFPRLPASRAIRRTGDPVGRRRVFAVRGCTRTLRFVSTPIIPGYIDGPKRDRLADLWQRPSGDYPEQLWPLDVLQQVEPEPTGWLTVCEHYSSKKRKGGRGCVLTAPESVPAALADTNWIGIDLGTFSVWENSEGEEGFDAGLNSTERDTELEFFVQVTRPAGSSDPVLDISQPFLWYFGAYPTRNGWDYLNRAGRPQELVRAQLAREHWIVELRALEFRQFLHACGRDAVMQVDCVPRTSSEGFAQVEDRFTSSWAHFDFVAASERAFSEGGFARLLGQYVVKGNRTSRVPRFEGRRRDAVYPEFTYAVDASTGEPLSHTCDPDQLGTYFDADNSRLHYLTPVNFRREVLIPYAQEPNRYQLTRSRLECLDLWGLDISFNTAGLIEVYLGDLGRDLPSDERSHWLTYNVIPEGEMELGRFRRNFLNQYAESPNIPGDLRRAREEVATATERLLGAPVWRPLGEDIAPEYKSMIGPLSEDPTALQAPVMLLAKCFVDAIDPAPLKAYLGDAKKGEKSLSLLGRTTERLGGSPDDVEVLRALYHARSAGGFAHLAGSGRAKAMTRLGIVDMSTIDAFDHVALRIIECLQKVAELADQATQ